VGEPRPIRIGTNFGNIVVTSAVDDEKRALLFRVAEDRPSHPVGDDEIAVPVNHGDWSGEGFHPCDSIEVHARNELPQRIHSGDEHSASHVLRGGERRLQHESSRVGDGRELSRDRAAERMSVKNETVRRYTEAVSREPQRGEGVLG